MLAGKMNHLYSLYKEYAGEDSSQVTPLTGSASNRKYFRLEGYGTSLIGVSGTDVLENKAFLTIARHFHSKGIPVPQVLAVSEDGMS